MDEINTDLIQLVRQHLKRPGGTGTNFVSTDKPPVYDEVTTWEYVTPLQALRWIAATWPEYKNGMNWLPVKLDKIIQYADMMTNGTWRADDAYDPIDITNGFVTGGKHRLHAVLLSHTTQYMRINHRTRVEEHS